MTRSKRAMWAAVAVAVIATSAAPVAAVANPVAETPEVSTANGVVGTTSATRVPDFTDVAATSGIAQPVKWLVVEGITQGQGGPGRFTPAGPVNRSQMARFLWRMMGRPAPSTSPCGFTDLGANPDSELIDATCWLKGEGITTGINQAGTLYGPTQSVTREQMAGFLWRLANRVDGATSCGFTDAPQRAEFKKAACWLKSVGVTTGTNSAGTLFSPLASVSRGQMASFLFRLVAAAGEWAPARLTADVNPCEGLDPDNCLLPFPSDVFTTDDPITDTGIRLDLPIPATPANSSGKHIDPTEQNFNDGFSPGQLLLLHLPGADLALSGAAPVTDIGKSLDDDAPVLIINAETGERHPHWVEYDYQAVSDDDRLLTVVPARNYEEGARYIVAIRGLVDGQGAALPATQPFASLRDGDPVDSPAAEARRSEVEALMGEFEALGRGIDTSEFQIAWDFTVASTRNLTERILHMRDEALGTLADNKADFSGARLTATRATRPTVDPDSSACQVARPPATCGTGGARLERTIVNGVIKVPNYQSNTVELPIKGGASFNWGSDGLPERNPSLSDLTVPYRCVFPRDNVVSADTPAKVSLYGHGLLGAYTEVSAGHVRDFADEHNVVFCAVSWHGFSGNDIGNALESLQDLSKFSAIADGGQQGLLHQMYLARALIHPTGFVSKDAFKSGGRALIDTSEIGYDGNSQGGIMGGALVAVSNDINRGVLGVPGMNYSLLLFRSSDWGSYASIFNPAYPEEKDRMQALSLAQIMWDRIEANGYAHHLTDQPTLPGTAAKQVMLHVAYADHQVAVVSADNLARTAGIRLYDPPALATNRAALWSTPGLGDNPDVEPFWGIQPIPTSEITDGWESGVYVMWDSGNTPPPTENVPPGSSQFNRPDVKPDPHERPRRAPGSREQKYDFLFEARLNPVCGQSSCLAPNP